MRHLRRGPTIGTSHSTVPDSHELPRQHLALLLVDLVESTRLMREHEADVIRRWQAFVGAVRSAIAPMVGGNVVNSRADGILMSFSTVPQAVAAAFAMHEAVAAYNRDRPASQWLVLRSGVHEGDVVVTADDLLGAEVNLTARIASQAMPGHTWVSAAARERLVEGLHAQLQDLGAHFLKHLEAPVHVYSASPPGSASAGPPLAPLPGHELRPTLAVVPFRCRPSDPSHDALGCAMADDIIAALVRNPGLRVLSRASTERLRDLPPDLGRIRSLLGASYLLRGDNHVHGSRVTLRAELASLESGEVLWAGSGTAEIAALFAGEDDLVPSIVAQVSQHVHAWELSRTRSLPMSTLASYTLYLGASGLLNSLAPADFARAREVLDHLVDRHPRQAAPHAMLAHWHLFRIAQGWAADRGQESGLARAHLSRALELDADLPEAHVSASVYTDMIADDPAGTLKHVDSALAVNPGHAHAWIMRSSAQVTLGDHEAGLHSARHAIALSPLDPRRYYFESFAARAAFACRRHADAVQLARASVRRNLHHAPSHRMLVGALWEDGQHEAARSAARLYVELFPSATAGGSVDPESSPRRTGRFVEALRAAGVPG